MNIKFSIDKKIRCVEVPLHTEGVMVGKSVDTLGWRQKYICKSFKMADGLQDGWMYLRPLFTRHVDLCMTEQTMIKRGSTVKLFRCKKKNFFKVKLRQSKIFIRFQQ